MSHMRELRRATGRLHRKLDTLQVFKNVMTERLTLEQYCQLLKAYYGLYAPFEENLYGRSDLLSIVPDLPLRLKAERALDDLRELASADEIDPQVDPIDIGNKFSCWPAALGALYVLEGSTLGGRVVRKLIMNGLGLTCGRGCGFLGSYGDQIDARWISLCAAIDKLTLTPEQQFAMIAGAKSTFVIFITRLEKVGIPYES